MFVDFLQVVTVADTKPGRKVEIYVQRDQNGFF